MKYCHKCHNIWNEIRQPGVRATCNKCSADLHVCLNCRYYYENKLNQCEKNNISLVLNKENSNQCDEFQFVDRHSSKEEQEARELWKRMFKK